MFLDVFVFQEVHLNMIRGCVLMFSGRTTVLPLWAHKFFIQTTPYIVVSGISSSADEFLGTVTKCRPVAQQQEEGKMEK